MTFEQYKNRLKEISAILESGDVTLDESIEYFEESIRLSAKCMELLENKKGTITMLKKQLDKITEQPLDGQTKDI